MPEVLNGLVDWCLGTDELFRDLMSIHIVGMDVVDGTESERHTTFIQTSDIRVSVTSELLVFSEGSHFGQVVASFLVLEFDHDVIHSTSQSLVHEPMSVLQIYTLGLRLFAIRWRSRLVVLFDSSESTIRLTSIA